MKKILITLLLLILIFSIGFSTVGDTRTYLANMLTRTQNGGQTTSQIFQLNQGSTIRSYDFEYIGFESESIVFSIDNTLNKEDFAINFGERDGYSYSTITYMGPYSINVEATGVCQNTGTKLKEIFPQTGIDAELPNELCVTNDIFMPCCILILKDGGKPVSSNPTTPMLITIATILLIGMLVIGPYITIKLTKPNQRKKLTLLIFFLPTLGASWIGLIILFPYFYMLLSWPMILLPILLIVPTLALGTTTYIYKKDPREFPYEKIAIIIGIMNLVFIITLLVIIGITAPIGV